MRIGHATTSLLLLLSIAVGRSQALPNGTQTDAPPALDDALHASGQAVVDGLVERGAPGASAAVVLPDGRVLTWVAGHASLDDEELLTPEHRLLSGSAGKTYVTAVAHDLVHAGELDFDEPLEAYFTVDPPAWLERVPNAREVTLRQLLQHRTGIPRYVFKPEFGPRLAAEPDHVWTPPELLAYVFDDPPLFAAGQGWAYSDTNYVLAGILIEEVTGQTFYDCVRERFLQPLELVDTIPTDTRTIPTMAQGHVVAGRQMGVPERTLAEGQFVYNVQFEWCGGGWASTPADLARWVGQLYSGRALDAPYLESMLAMVPAPALGPGVEYGLGAMRRTTAAGPLIYHDGFMPGYLTTTGWFPELEIAATIQLNTDEGRSFGQPPSELLAELARSVHAELAR